MAAEGHPHLDVKIYNQAMVCVTNKMVSTSWELMTELRHVKLVMDLLDVDVKAE